VGDALRTDTDRAASSQEFPGRNESFLVFTNVCPFVLMAVDRKRIHGANDKAQNRIVEERGFGEKRNFARSKAQQERRIDERVGVIENEDNRVRAWHIVEADYFHVPEIDPHRKSQERNNDSAGHVRLSGVG
jgi:hypothetical protein